jgi:hypothetical protein
MGCSGRVSRPINRRIAAELAIDYSRGALELPRRT